MMCGSIYRNSLIVAVAMSATTLITSATHASISELRVWSSRSFQFIKILLDGDSMMSDASARPLCVRGGL